MSVGVAHPEYQIVSMDGVLEEGDPAPKKKFTWPDAELNT